MRLLDYADREMLAMGLADALASGLKTALTANEAVSLCVPGGSSPGETFATLSGVDLEWSRVRVFLGDERWVPEDDPRSNTALLRTTLLTDRASKAALVPMISDAPTPEAGVETLTPAIEAALPISVLLLGMGADMHTASLIPDAERLDEAMAEDAPALMAVRAPSVTEPRITLSRRVLADAMETHVLVMGDEKRAALERAQRLDPMEAPIAAFLRDAVVHRAP